MTNAIKSLFAKKEPVKIGHLTPLSGEYARYGVWESEGIDLAAARINKKGGINGQKVVIAREDDRLDPVLSVVVFNKLIDTQKIQAAIGSPNSDVILADAAIAQTNKVVLISTAAGSPKISFAGEYVFRIFPLTGQEGEKLVSVAEQRGYKNAAIIYINNQYGLDLAKAVRRGAIERKIDILGIEGYKKDIVDFCDQLGRIKEKNPSVVFLLGYPKDMGLILRQAQELGIKCEYLASNTFGDPGIIAVAGKGAEGIIYVYPDEEYSPEFFKSFKKRYKKDPNIFNALGYDCLNLLALAIGKGGNNGTAIKDELFKVKDYQGASGIITFDKNGDAINRPLQLKTIKEGKAVPFVPNIDK